MPQPVYLEKKILIWAKTYPELSKKHLETVCTAGVLEDGSPVRLYPIPYRYTEIEKKFRKYQWITARIARNPNDPRPESYKVDCDSITLGDLVNPTTDEWGKRAEIVFRHSDWQFQTWDSLMAAQQQNKTSLGCVTPRKIINIEIIPRSADEAKSFEEKVEDIRRTIKAQQAQINLFEESIPADMRHLDFLESRIRIYWLCSSETCQGHKMQVLDWELCELCRREGDEKAKQKLQSICDLSIYATRFFLGNLFLHPTSFMIVGLWYPKRSDGRLF